MKENNGIYHGQEIHKHTKMCIYTKAILAQTVHLPECIWEAKGNFRNHQDTGRTSETAQTVT